MGAPWVETDRDLPFRSRAGFYHGAASRYFQRARYFRGWEPFQYYWYLNMAHSRMAIAKAEGRAP
jgi:hypothetical protein